MVHLGQHILVGPRGLFVLCMALWLRGLNLQKLDQVTFGEWICSTCLKYLKKITRANRTKINMTKLSTRNSNVRQHLQIERKLTFLMKGVGTEMLNLSLYRPSMFFLPIFGICSFWFSPIQCINGFNYGPLQYVTALHITGEIAKYTSEFPHKLGK